MRGSHTEIVLDLDDPMVKATCVRLGECVAGLADRAR